MAIKEHQIFFEAHFNAFESLFAEHGEYFVFEEGDQFSAADEQYIYYTLEGTFVLYLIEPQGEQKAFCYHSKGTITPYSLVRPQADKSYAMDLDFFVIRAINQVKTYRIKPAVFHALMMKHPELALCTIDYIINHSSLYLFESINLSYYTANEKTCNFIYKYTLHLQPQGITLTQEEIADFIGVSRLSVARSLKKLRDQGIIQTSRFKIDVIDLPRLQAFVTYEV